MEWHARYALIGAFVLTVLAAGFGFTYWLKNTGGLGQRTTYLVRFESSVSGLAVGAPVTFNGIKVGEVTDLVFGIDDPRQVTATIVIDARTPVRRDTRVTIESQGLLGGTVAITLLGGAPTAPPLERGNGGPALLHADVGAAASMTDAARDALQRLDAILADNAQSLHSAIDNINTFSAVLARNSDRIDSILAGLERMTGAPAKLTSGFDLTVPASFPAIARIPSGQLVVPEPTTLVIFDSQRILTRSRDQLSIIDNAQWSDSVPKLVQAKLIQAFENANYQKVARPMDALTTDFQLLIDVRSFDIAVGSAPVAEVTLSAKILSQTGKIVATRTFHAETPAGGLDAAQSAAALNQAFGAVTVELVVWTCGAI